MIHRRFGATGPQVPVVGIGTWQMEADDPAAATAAIRAALDAGATHVDTAEMYGGGRVERMVGEAIAGRRDDVFLVSKVLPDNASYAGTIAACEGSLRRLRTDRLDSYLLHWAGEQPLEETIRAFARLKKEGKVLSFGVSNFDEDELAEAVRIAGANAIACNQVLYHLGERAIEHAVVPFCEEHGIAVVAYSPFGSRGGFPAETERGGKALASVAAKHGATPRQVALAFLARRDSTFVIPKTADADHALENAAAGNLTLDDADVAAIDAAFPRGPRQRGVPTL